MKKWRPRFSAIKTSIAILSVLALLFVAGPAHADWIYDIPLSGIPEDVAYISIKAVDRNVFITTVETKDGVCTDYRVVKGEIVKVRKCGDTDWKDYVKK